MKYLKDQPRTKPDKISKAKGQWQHWRRMIGNEEAKEQHPATRLAYEVALIAQRQRRDIRHAVELLKRCRPLTRLDYSDLYLAQDIDKFLARKFK